LKKMLYREDPAGVEERNVGNIRRIQEKKKRKRNIVRQKRKLGQLRKGGKSLEQRNGSREYEKHADVVTPSKTWDRRGGAGKSMPQEGGGWRRGRQKKSVRKGTLGDGRLLG